MLLTQNIHKKRRSLTSTSYAKTDRDVCRQRLVNPLAVLCQCSTFFTAETLRAFRVTIGGKVVGRLRPKTNHKSDYESRSSSRHARLRYCYCIKGQPTTSSSLAFKPKARRTLSFKSLDDNNNMIAISCALCNRLIFR